MYEGLSVQFSVHGFDSEFEMAALRPFLVIGIRPKAKLSKMGYSSMPGCMGEKKR
jgi:hypothetical protein